MGRVINCTCGKPMYENKDVCLDCEAKELDELIDSEEKRDLMVRNSKLNLQVVLLREENEKLRKANGVLLVAVEHYKSQVPAETFTPHDINWGGPKKVENDEQS